ncbi:hypothetical protein GCM10011506_00770 [Marivirga lumbricoides]|uniref:DUF4199 domain-containing protein n=1 Tax=Marivirga lumbricoides TaxID=1046115 RepID=A0ABQ1LAS6_9BACT|nr:hypothetical protein GCM10011506_00770 [Marivirga lumbricoides]
MKNVTIEIKWAIIFTVVTLLWMLLEKLVGLHDQYLDYHIYLTNLFAIPAIIMMVLALKDKKKNFYDGQMSYKEGFIAGLLLSLFIALLSPLSQWITTYIITPDYFPNVIKHSVEMGYFETREEAAANFNYKSYAIQSAVGALVMGVLTTAIAMIFIRSKSKI